MRQKDLFFWDLVKRIEGALPPFLRQYDGGSFTQKRSEVFTKKKRIPILKGFEPFKMHKAILLFV
jgi:hypothetical protein